MIMNYHLLVDYLIVNEIFFVECFYNLLIYVLVGWITKNLLILVIIFLILGIGSNVLIVLVTFLLLIRYLWNSHFRNLSRNYGLLSRCLNHLLSLLTLICLSLILIDLLCYVGYWAFDMECL